MALAGVVVAENRCHPGGAIFLFNAPFAHIARDFTGSLGLGLGAISLFVGCLVFCCAGCSLCPWWACFLPPCAGVVSPGPAGPGWRFYRVVGSFDCGPGMGPCFPWLVPG